MHLCDGKDNGEIADIMHLGHQTVKNYISSIYSKMGVHNRMDAFRLASQSGIHTGSQAQSISPIAERPC